MKAVSATTTTTTTTSSSTSLPLPAPHPFSTQKAAKHTKAMTLKIKNPYCNSYLGNRCQNNDKCLSKEETRQKHCLKNSEKAEQSGSPNRRKQTRYRIMAIVAHATQDDCKASKFHLVTWSLGHTWDSYMTVMRDTHAIQSTTLSSNPAGESTSTIACQPSNIYEQQGAAMTNDLLPLKCPAIRQSERSDRASWWAGNSQAYCKLEKQVSAM